MNGPLHYVTIYDAANFGRFLNLAFVLPGVMMIVGAVHLIRHPEKISRGLPEPALRWLFLPVSVLWTVIAAGRLFSNAARATYDGASTGQCTVVRGIVQHFIPEPPSGRGYRSFDVKGVSFRYSDPIITAGFHFTGLLRQSLPVRIYYREGQILRLEVAKT